MSLTYEDAKHWAKQTREVLRTAAGEIFLDEEWRALEAHVHVRAVNATDSDVSYDLETLWVALLHVARNDRRTPQEVTHGA